MQYLIGTVFISTGGLIFFKNKLFGKAPINWSDKLVVGGIIFSALIFSFLMSAIGVELFTPNSQHWIHEWTFNLFKRTTMGGGTPPSQHIIDRVFYTAMPFAYLFCFSLGLIPYSYFWKRKLLLRVAIGVTLLSLGVGHLVMVWTMGQVGWR